MEDLDALFDQLIFVLVYKRIVIYIGFFSELSQEALKIHMFLLCNLDCNEHRMH